MIELDKKKILEIQKNRPPYLMIDHATKVVPGKSASGYKDLELDEWFFKVHWEGDPNMPGMLQIESLVQMSSLSILCLPGNEGKFMYLIAATNLKFLKKINLYKILINDWPSITCTSAITVEKKIIKKFLDSFV